jgi:membrane protein DedA with SNARE-associated domain
LLALFNPTGFVTSSGYLAIFLLSVLQSCCVPTSSELTLGFAGVLAAEGSLSLPGAIAAGTLGEVVGAYIAWLIGRSGGRAFVDRFGRYLLLSNRDLERAEAWYERHGNWGVFGSRLLPVIRNFVALPAGVAEVPIVRFGLLTAAGSLIWDGSMALIGYEVGGRWKSIMHGFSDAGYLLGALAAASIAIFLVHRYRSYKSGSVPAGGEHPHAGATALPAPASGGQPREPS